MPAFIACPACRKRLKVPDDQVGLDKLVQCPACGEKINLAQATEQPGQPAVDRLDAVEGDDEPRREAKEGRRRPRDEDEEDDEDRPRARKKRPREDDDEDEEDDRPARRRRPARKKKSGSSVGLVIGIVAGVVLLLIAGCGVGAYFVFSRAKDVAGAVAAVADNPAVTQANFEKVQTDMPLPAVEGIFGPGAAANGGDVKALLAPGGGNRVGLEQQVEAVADNPGAYGVTAWYRWKNGPTTMVIAVDGANKVRVAGLVTVTPNSRSSSWKSSLAVGGGRGGAPPRRR